MRKPPESKLKDFKVPATAPKTPLELLLALSETEDDPAVQELRRQMEASDGLREEDYGQIINSCIV